MLRLLARLCTRTLSLALFSSVLLRSELTAQIVERQIPFDSAGRVMEITPSLAVRVGLAPPAWRISGDYVAARLYAAGDSSYVIVVARRDGSLERFPVTRADVDALRAQLGSTTSPASGERSTRRAFVRNQVLLGLAVYGPAAAAAVGGDGAAQTGAYLITAGGSFFLASQLVRSVSQPQLRLSTHAALRGAAGGWGLTYAFGAEREGQAAGALVGGLAGTVSGFMFGRSLTDAEAAGAGFGADVAVVTTLGVLGAINGERDPRPISTRTQAGLLVGAGLLGYPIGVLYPRNANYNVTPGDVSTLWLTGALGALGAATFLVNGDPSAGTAAAVLTGGFILGTVAGDLFLVRNLDHSEGEATLVGLGMVAGGLVGAGIYVLTDRNADRPALGTALATLGGVAGIALTERFVEADADRGHTPRVSFRPGNLMVASLLHSRHAAPMGLPLFTVRF